jgi:hypothetical protein
VHKRQQIPACAQKAPATAKNKTEMRLDDLHLWYLGDPTPRYVGALKLVAAGKGVSLRYASGLAVQMDLRSAKTCPWWTASSPRPGG